MAQPFTDLILALPNLRFAYPLDAAGTTDVGPNGLTLTANNTPGTTSPGPVLDDDATSFNGTDESMSHAHDAAYNFGTSDFTVGMFVNPDSVSGTKFLMAHHGNGDAGTWEMRMVNRQIGGRIAGSTDVITGNVMATGWQFVALVADRDGNGRWWRNDDWAHAGTDISALSGTNVDFNGTLWIARRQSTGWFAGSIAWAFGCASALTESQLDALYAARDDAAGVTGTGAVTVILSASATGTPVVTGSAAASIAPAASASGTPVVTGTGAPQVAPGASGTGTTVITATGAASVAPSVSASGTVVVTGAGAATVAPSASATGTPVVTGTSAATVAPSVASSGTPVVTGTGAATVQPAVAGQGAELEPVTGTGAVSVAPSVSASGSGIVTGSGVITIPAAMVAALGTQVVTGTGGVSVAPSVAGMGAVFDWDLAVGVVSGGSALVGVVSGDTSVGVVSPDSELIGVVS